jgi:ankyrin repeat/IBR domain-containing protein 1
LQEGHEPASCKNWKDWYEKIMAIKPEELRHSNEKEEISANYLWLVTNSKLCPNPNCNAPIQKNEGCNHIKCYKCKHDFCWICMEPWKKHSSATGGYFQCNRYEVSSKVGQKEKQSIAQAEEVYVKAAELNKFVHYYTRFKNHENSYKVIFKKFYGFFNS